MDMQHCMTMQHIYIWACSIDMDTQHVLGHAAWTWTCRIDLGMKHGEVQCCIHAARPCPCFMSMCLLHVSVNTACSNPRRMDLDGQHEPEHADIDMDIHTYSMSIKKIDPQWGVTQSSLIFLEFGCYGEFKNIFYTTKVYGTNMWMRLLTTSFRVSVPLPRKNGNKVRFWTYQKYDKGKVEVKHRQKRSKQKKWTLEKKKK